METKLSSLLSAIFLAFSILSCDAITEDYGISSFNRSNFPPGFIFGAASASYQYEGAAQEEGKSPSNWDAYTHKYPERIEDGSNGDVATDSYHMYKTDVEILKNMGMDAYRFSISWSRIIPSGKKGGGVNRKGVNYYNNLINELLAQGKKPFVTLFHWDIPQTLEDEYGGFLSSRVVEDFVEFVDTCFKEFGDRVKHWITLNEPFMYSRNGYAIGKNAPGRCSSWINNCTGGNSALEPYIVSHNQLLAHAAAVNLYRENYQAYQKGEIGITNVCTWMEPFSKSKRDIKASERAIDFNCGWFMDPIVNGYYPLSMRQLVGKRLPKFSETQSSLLKGSYDFIGLNYYTANYAAHLPTMDTINVSYVTDSRANLSTERNGVDIGPRAASNWLYVYPKGILDMLLYLKNKYNNPIIYITENGIDEINNATLPLKEALRDEKRIDFYYRHLSFLKRAIDKGVKVKGYFAWSLLDNFEWSSGYTVGFGLNYVNYKNGLKRYPKLSAKWFKKFLSAR